MTRVVIHDTAKPVVEIDPKAMAVYVRFRKGKVARTVADDRAGATLAVDYNAAGEVLGVEFVGGTIRSIRQILDLANVEARVEDVSMKIVA